MEHLPQNLAPIVTEILNLDPSAYRALTAPPSGNRRAKEILAAVAPQSLLLPGSPTGRADPQAMLAGLWLWHDWLAESHVVSQNLHTPTGSFWHALLQLRLIA
jgi:hypothetical protein